MKDNSFDQMSIIVFIARLFILIIASLLMLSALKNIGKKNENNKIVAWLISLTKGTIVFIVLSFAMYIMSCIYASTHEPVSNIDVMVILGAGVNEDKPGETLKGRLDEGIKYLNLNRSTKVIVSGGIGSNEKTSEASVMKKYLIEKGIDFNRILEESSSTNTKENIEYSKDIFKKNYRIDSNNISLIIITNEFHMYRSISIAKNLWGGKIDFSSSKSILKYIPWFVLREYMALFVKYKYSYIIYIVIFIYSRKRWRSS